MVHQELLSGLAGGVPREAAFSIVRATCETAAARGIFRLNEG